MMIGQEKLINTLDGLIDGHQVPRFSIVLGDRGAEHEDVARYVANKMQANYIQLLDVKVDTVRNMIKEAYSLHDTTVFCIPNADDMSPNAKNAMLKVVEEAPNRAYFFMCLEDLNNTLQTLISRCQVLYMDMPSPDEIAEFARSLYVNQGDVDEEVVRICKNICFTSGDVCMLLNMGAVNFYRYVEWVADNIYTMPSAESFKLTEKVSVKEDDGKYDCRLFLRAFQTVIMKRVCDADLDTLTDTKYRWCEIARATGHYLQDLRVKGVNRAMLLDMWLLEVRKIWKSQT